MVRALKMSFLSVPFICEPISNQPIAFTLENCSQFASLELADSSLGDNYLDVDVLIGSDHVLQIGYRRSDSVVQWTNSHSYKTRQGPTWAGAWFVTRKFFG